MSKGLWINQTNINPRKEFRQKLQNEGFAFFVSIQRRLAGF